MKRHIPNIITLCNLLCGCIAVIYAAGGNVYVAGGWVLLGIFFDFFDGFFARLLKVKSEIGLQLDSLADMVTSGVVPGITMYQMLQMSDIMKSTNAWVVYLPYIGFFITLASAYRLANFNIDTRQTTGFIGLPTPANALFIISLAVIQSTGTIMLLHSTWVLLVITIISSYLLNANLPLFALKFKDYSFKNNAVKYIFLAISVLLIAILKVIAVPIIILLYILLSLITKR
ncbi:CDP-alcohol phosphatidyltransferase family protein [Capnocytophaga leadbetteri]|jgi:CDP-diacylglycerol-serine O-phosphatidyltransferase|uniref:CDP-alcohol phosphatidyltransferase family protein n=1 Tax=Capnocytophaga leadbetteri TaxID=327575 RepID=UPI0028E4F7C7|nr:CDP-alcohol phosphatidyltransferase family protein [Capnocytophaga leadbetteri]